MMASSLLLSECKLIFSLAGFVGWLCAAAYFGRTRQTQRLRYTVPIAVGCLLSAGQSAIKISATAHFATMSRHQLDDWLMGFLAVTALGVILLVGGFAAMIVTERDRERAKRAAAMTPLPDASAQAHGETWPPAPSRPCGGNEPVVTDESSPA